MAADPRFFPQAGPQRLEDLLAALDEPCSASGAADLVLTGVAPLAEAERGQLSYCDGARNIAALRRTAAGAVFVQEAQRGAVPEGCLALVVRHPALAFSRAVALFHPPPRPQAGIHPTAVIGAGAEIGAGTHVGPYAVIGEGARLGPDCVIGPHAVVGEGVVLGEGCRLHAHSSISHAICGRGVVLHPGARVGQEGFGFVPTPEGRFVTMPQLGLVRLEDGVEIGANACVDRGSHADTVIGAGTRLDNLVQVGHNVRMGPGCVLVSQSGVSGSTTLGRYVTLAGQAGLTGHLTIGDGARIGAQAGVMRDVPAGADMLGSPAMPVKEAMRAMMMMKRLAAQQRAAARDGEKD
ncbi:UDP-3-O-(3-hydroxymyristoyl)glucosamine N-acyltransferase [Roseococcus thiosulfatophilus]|uniref:UDP-3-O-(3-hydroxymyristoyl)glucosamine N-acyltransferase n=1 Tax=Roseococcus thiosulfatophilus TaxID=35813 RepID=UPI001A9030A5|nr:UDP-3-O-(3-hydroxymyristoyl)glucosamine N-acyltransferase [Roseococcus thiosulfatophilus]